MEQANYRFDVKDFGSWVPFLQSDGYAVLSGVANPEEVQTAINLFWELFETEFDIKRNDYSTWEKWSTDQRGIVLHVPTMQGKGAWYIRGLPNVKFAYSKIWNDEDLIVSMDSLLLWKPWWINSKWYPRTEGLHVDQNYMSKPHLDCVQGMLALYDVTEEIGGLEVVPKSHLEEARNDFIAFYKEENLRHAPDFVRIPRGNKMQGTGKLLLAKSGDLIIWDSRTVHGGKVGTLKQNTILDKTTIPSDQVKLARLTMTVNMTPRKKASQDVLEERKTGFEKGCGFNHCPHEPNITTRAKGTHTPIQLSPAQLALL